MWNMGIQDKKLLAIINEMLKAEIQHPDGTKERATMGTPQGGVLSPLLANIYLNELDWWISGQWETFQTVKDYSRVRASGALDQSGKYRALRKSSNLKEMMIVRYADDFKIFTNTEDSASKILIAVTNWLQERLKLRVSPDKSGVTDLKKQSTEFLGFSFRVRKKGKANNGNTKYVLTSDISNKAKSSIKATLSQQIKVIQRASTSHRGIDEVLKYNSMVVGMHNYYRIATNVNDGFNRIALGLLRKMHNRWNRNNQNNNFTRIGHYAGKDARITRYMKSKAMRYYLGHPIVPASYVQHKSPMMLKRAYRNIDTIEDIHVKMEIGKLRKNAHYNNRRSIEYMDNRIAKFIAQKGKCAVTGILLYADEVTCHHIVPHHISQDDSYANLVIVHEDIHRLIHATQESTINRYRIKMKLSKKEMTHVNKYRALVGNDEIRI